MRKHQFGQSGAAVPIIGQGSWQFSASKNALDETKKALRYGVEMGMTHIDTAEMYGDAELVIAEAIKGLKREELFIVSKVLPSNANYEGTLAACDKSLRRLGIDYLDCYLLHWKGKYPLEQTMSALEKLVDDGKIKSLGVSNLDVNDLKEAESKLKKHKIVCNQVLYNMYERGIERNLIPYCREKNIAVVGYTPFGQRKPPANNSKQGEALNSICQKHGATARQIMLSFLTREEILFTIPKAAQPDHTKENAGAANVELDTEDIGILNKIFPAPERDVPLAMI